MSDPFFSVIVPLYNTEKYITETIESVVCQTYHNWELIIIDDGSTDTSLSLAVEAATRDSRIIVLQHEAGKNKGVSATRNLGIERARGKWLAFLDADDLWHKNKLERQFEAINQYDKDLVFIYSRAFLLDDKGARIDSKSPFKYNRKNKLHGAGEAGMLRRPFKQIISKGFDAPTSSVVIKKSIVDESHIKFQEHLNYSEDGLFFFQVIQYGDVFFIDIPLMDYRLHSSQWNARTNAETKMGRRFLGYTELLKICLPEYRQSVSFLLVSKGFRILSRYYLTCTFSLNVLLKYSKIVFTNRNVFIHHKLYLIIVLLSELLIVPALLIKYGTERNKM